MVVSWWIVAFFAQCEVVSGFPLLISLRVFFLPVLNKADEYERKLVL